MKCKPFLFRVFLVFLVLLAGFNLFSHLRLNRQEDVRMAAREETAHPSGVTVVLLNESETEVETGNLHNVRLQRRLLGVWFPVWRDFTAAYTDEAFGYAPHAWHEVELGWKGAYGEKGPGTYRVLKRFWTSPDTGERESFWLSAEFTIP